MVCILAGVAVFSQRAPQPEGRPLGREDFAFSSPGIQTEAIESIQELASVDPSAPATPLLPVSQPVKEAVHSLPATPHDLGPGGGISEHDRAAIARNLVSLAELPRPLEASVAAPVERGEDKAVDETAARPAEQASSASPSPSTAVTTAREAGLHFGQPGPPGRLAAGRYSGSGAADRAVPRLTEASDNALDRGMAAAMPPVPSPAPAVPLARPNGSEQASPGRIAEAQRLLTRLGYAPGAADGVLGKRTETAIRAFQRRKGATADGEGSPAGKSAATHYCTRAGYSGSDSRRTAVKGCTAGGAVEGHAEQLGRARLEALRRPTAQPVVPEGRGHGAVRG
jgi:Putative peptidoglycan binding domain